MKAKSLVLAMMVLISVGLISCTEVSSDKSQIQVDKHSSIVIDMKIQHMKDFDQLITTKWVYDSKGTLSKILYAYDSLPLLGMVKDTLVITNKDGNERDTIVTHAKDYQFFITVSK